MGRLVPTLLVAAGVAIGAGGGVLLAGGDDDREIAPITVPAANIVQQREAPRVVVDDGVPADQAEQLAETAAAHAQGTALSVDTDDGFYEVEVQRPNGAIVEVLLDGDRVIDLDADDGDG